MSVFGLKNYIKSSKLIFNSIYCSKSLFLFYLFHSSLLNDMQLGCIIYSNNLQVLQNRSEVESFHKLKKNVYNCPEGCLNIGRHFYPTLATLILHKSDNSYRHVSQRSAVSTRVPNSATLISETDLLAD